jgi:hypothetical protein
VVHYRWDTNRPAYLPYLGRWYRPQRGDVLTSWLYTAPDHRGRGLQRASQDRQIIRARDFHGPEAGQVRGDPLGIEQKKVSSTQPFQISRGEELTDLARAHLLERWANGFGIDDNQLHAEVRCPARGVLLNVLHLASAVRTRTEQTADDAALVPGIPHTGIGAVPIRDVLIEDPDRRVGGNDIYSRETPSIQLSTRAQVLAAQVHSQ